MYTTYDLGYTKSILKVSFRIKNRRNYHTQWGNTRLGYRRIAGSQILTCSITNEKLAKAGYYDFRPNTSSCV